MTAPHQDAFDPLTWTMDPAQVEFIWKQSREVFGNKLWFERMLYGPGLPAPWQEELTRRAGEGIMEVLLEAVGDLREPDPSLVFLGLRDAFARAHRETGRSSFGKVLTVEQVPAALEAFARIAGGAPWDGAGLPGDPVSVASDVRTYYEEAAVALAGHVPEARRAEAWFVERTEAGRVVRAAQKVMRQRKDPHFLWYYLLPLGWRDRTSAT